MERRASPATCALYGRAGPVTFANRGKSNQKRLPHTPLHPPVLATDGMRQWHTKASLTLRRVCADDASTTARYSAPQRELKGRFDSLFDSFAIRVTRTRMRASGLRFRSHGFNLADQKTDQAVFAVISVRKRYNGK